MDVPVNHPEFGRLQVCSCRQQEVMQKTHHRLFQFANLESVGGLRFDTFEPLGRSGTLTENQAISLQTAFNTCQQYAGSLEGWLLILGPFGCGKTHLAAAIANQAVSMGVPTLFLTVPDLLDWMRFAYSDPETTFEHRFDEIRNIKLLILDDFGTENATPWAQEKLFQVLNYRYMNRLPVVITTNQPMESIEQRIRSRLQDPSIAQRLHINAPDYRHPSSAGDHPDLSSLNLHQKQTFDTFNLRKGEGLQPDESNSLEKAFLAAKKFALDPQGWLVLLGDYSTGKTHLAAAVGNYRSAVGYPPLLVSVPDLLDYLRASFHPESRESYDRRFEEIRTCSLLILDDLGAQSSTPWAKEKLYQLFNYRYDAELPTVITSSLKLDDIDARLRMKLIDSRIAKIYPLVVPSYTGQSKGGVSRRKK
jgi:DNA replication protein DnaC